MAASRSGVFCIVAVVFAFGCKGGGGKDGSAPVPVASAPATAGAEAQEASREAGEEEEIVEMSGEYSFTKEQKAWLMKVAKESAAAAAKGEQYAPPEPDPSWALVKGKGAAFVTLRRKKDDSLRGCIGHIIARIPLYRCVADMGHAAAVEDGRFSPVTPSEIPEIRFEISVLTPLQPVKDPEEIVVGTDGVVLEHGWNHGVFLPQVPTEQGWDRTEYLDNLCYKAGLYSAGCWKDPKAVLKKFQAIVWEEEDVAG